MATPSTQNEPSDFLANDEEMHLNFEGTLTQGEEVLPALFVVTNNRLVISHGQGHFKDVGLQHIESVEVGTDVRREMDGTPADAGIVVGGIAALIGLGSIIISGFSPAASLFGLIVLVIGTIAIFDNIKNYEDRKEDVEVTQHTYYQILVQTNAGSPFAMPFLIETKENVGPDLSRLVQEAN